MTGDYRERGIKDLHGFMTELVVDEECYLHLVPRELRDVAVLVEPLTIAEKALLQLKGVQQRLPWTGNRHRALVLGAGPVGLLGAMAMVNAGFEVHVYSREPESTTAQAIGAAYHSCVAESIEDVARRIGNIDLVYEATGASQFAFEVLRSLGANGIFVFTGVPGRHDRVNLDTDTIMRNMVMKNQVVLGTVNAGHDAFEAAIADLGAFYARWPAAVRSLITGRYPIEAFHDLLYGHPGGIKNIISLE